MCNCNSDSSENNKILRTLRAAEFSKAKGHLDAMLQTFWNEEKFDRAYEEVKKFVKVMEDEGLSE